MSNLTYENLRQWRNICEFLNGEWYKFLDIEDNDFSLLSPSGREQRHYLWKEYFIQLVKWTDEHPHSYYNRRSLYRKCKGWILLPGWETKIDFLEQVAVLNRQPQDLPQPWRDQIWRSLAKKIENRVKAEEEQRRRIEEFERQRVEYYGRLDRIKLHQKEYHAHIDQGGCPAFFNCLSMSGALHSKECPNFQACKSIGYRFD